VVAELDQDAPRGRGIRIVQGLAARWGVDDHEDGKRVWAELALSPRRRPHPTLG
jgi:hypothetical protein